MNTAPQPPRPQHANHVPENASPALCVSWHSDTDVLPVLPVLPGQRPRSPPLPHRRPVPAQPHGHAGSLQSVVPLPLNPARNGQHDGPWDDIPLPLEDIAANWHDQPQDLQHINMAYYDMAHYFPVPSADHHVAQQEYDYRGVNSDARAYQDVPAQVQVVASAAPEINIFGYAARQDEADPDRAFLGEWPHQGPVPNDPAGEVLRQIASRYLRQPGSQVDMVRMEPGLAGGIRVVITIELADLL